MRPTATTPIRLLALFLALLTLAFLLVACHQKTTGTEEEEQTLPEETNDEPVIDGDGFAPVLRFVAASDIHTRALGYDQATPDEVNAAKSRLADMFVESYAYAKGNPYYQKLDAVLLVGDYTDYGRTAQYDNLKRAIKNVRDADETQLLACLGNHEFWAAGEWGLTETVTTGTYRNFRNYFNMEPDSHVVINGFHFIGVSPDIHGGRSYSIEKSNWLKAELEAAKADDPTGKKPIFVYVHVAPNTLDEEERYANKFIEARLATYPQAVVISGHTHLPANDVTAVMQNNFTQIGTGTMAYCGYTMFTNHGSSSRNVRPMGLEGSYVVSSDDAYTEHGEKETAVFTIVEVDANNRVRLSYYDLNAGAFLGEPVIIASIGNRKQFEYTSGRKTKSETPYWADGAAVTELAVTPTTARLSFPQALCAAGVRNYQLDLTDENGRVTTIYRLSRYNTALMPERLLAPFSGLTPDTAYTLKIYAFSCWGRQNSCAALSYAFRTPADTGTPAPEVFSAVFDETGAVNAVTGTALKKNGTAAFSAEEGAAVFTREGDYTWDGIASYYDMMTTSVTLEADVRISALPESGKTCGILSNYNTEIIDGRISGGMSLEYDRNGRVIFRIFIKDVGERTVMTAACLSNERFTHVAATYDGRVMKIYLDGELAATSANDETVSYAGSIWFPHKTVEQFLIVGGTGNYTLTANRMGGSVKKANVYARVLNESQIRALATAQPQT